MRLANDARDLNPARLDVDDEQDVVANETNDRQDLDVEEVHRGDGAQMGVDERLPGQALAALGCGRKAVVLENAFDGVSTNDVAEITECVAQSRVAPSE